VDHRGTAFRFAFGPGDVSGVIDNMSAINRASVIRMVSPLTDVVATCASAGVVCATSPSTGLRE
jgi:hypothetical protein